MGQNIFFFCFLCIQWDAMRRSVIIISIQDLENGVSNRIGSSDARVGGNNLRTLRKQFEFQNSSLGRHRSLE